MANEIFTNRWFRSLARSLIVYRIMKRLGLMLFIFCCVDVSCAERKCENARHNESGFCFKREIISNVKRQTSEWRKKGDKEIIYKRILMDDPLFWNWLSLLIMSDGGEAVEWRDNLCALAANSYPFPQRISLLCVSLMAEKWDACVAVGGNDLNGVEYQKRLTARKMFVKWNPSRRKDELKTKVKKKCGRRGVDFFSYQEPDAHMSMETKYFRQFHIFLRLIYLFWVSCIKCELQTRFKFVSRMDFTCIEPLISKAELLTFRKSDDSSSVLFDFNGCIIKTQSMNERSILQGLNSNASVSSFEERS